MPDGVGDTSYTGGWKILGVDDDGRLLISMSQLIDVNQDLYSYNLLSVLKETVSSYKDGVYGIEVRSLKDEDFDSYDKYSWEKGKIRGYGNVVTLKWKEVSEGEEPDYYPEYSYVYESETYTGQLTEEHKNGFRYYDVKTDKIITVPYKAGETIAVIENNYYGRDFRKNNAFLNIVKDFNVNYCLLANVTVNCRSSLVAASIRHLDLSNFETMSSMSFSGFIAERSYETESNIYQYVKKACAVVTLADNVVLTESEEVEGTYDLSLVK